MITKATVISTHGDKAKVRVLRQSACDGCEGCSEKGKCHSEIMLSEAPKSYELELDNAAGAKAGDLVEIKSSGNFVLIFAALIFVLPIVFTIAAYMVSDIFFYGNIPVMISALTFVTVFTVSAIVTNKLIPKYSHNIISKIIKENSK